MVVTGRNAAVAQIDPSYFPGGATVIRIPHLM